MNETSIQEILKDHDRSLKAIGEAMAKIATIQAEHDKSIISLSRSLDKIVDKMDDITIIIREERQATKDMMLIITEHQHYKPQILARIERIEEAHSNSGCQVTKHIASKVEHINTRLAEIENLKNRLLYSVIGLVALAVWDIFVKFKG